MPSMRGCDRCQGQGVQWCQGVRLLLERPECCSSTLHLGHKKCLRPSRWKRWQPKKCAVDMRWYVYLRNPISTDLCDLTGSGQPHGTVDWCIAPDGCNLPLWFCKGLRENVVRKNFCLTSFWQIKWTHCCSTSTVRTAGIAFFWNSVNRSRS